MSNSIPLKVTAVTLPDGRVQIDIEPHNGPKYTVVGSPICELDMAPPELDDITADLNGRRLPSRPEIRFTLKLEHVTEVARNE